MTFLAPLFLLGALGVALPLWLHWRDAGPAERRVVPSLLLFEAGEQPSVRRRQLQHFLLLALRTALLLLAALAFARPIWPSLLGASPASEGSLQLIVLDASFSMAYGERWARAQSIARDLIAALGPNDRAQVLSASSRLEILTEVTQDASALRDAVSKLEPSASRSVEDRLRQSLRAHVEQLERRLAERRLAVQVHLISDFQRSSLETRAAGLGLAPEVRSVTHSVAEPSPANWFIEDVRFVPGSEGRVRLDVSVRGVGTPQARKTLVLAVDGAPEEREGLELPADGRASLSFAAREWPVGETRARVRIEPPDALPRDDLHHVVWAQPAPRDVLLVANPAAAREARAYAAALEIGDPLGARIERADPRALAGRELETVAVVVIVDAPLPEAAQKRLRAFLERGGGMLIFAGPAVAGKNDSAGGRLEITGHALDAPVRADTAFRVQRAETQGDASPRALGENAGWSDVRVFQRASLRPASGDGVLLRTGDGAPLLVEHPVGKGLALVFASGLGQSWNDLPLEPVFVSFVRESIRYLADRREPQRALRVDDVLALQGEAAQVYDPRGAPVLALAETQQGKNLSVVDVGFYEVRRPSGGYTVAVRSDPRESDVRSRSPQEIALLDAPGERAGPIQVASGGAGSTPGKSSQPLGTPLAWPLLCCLAAVVIGESSVANWRLRAQEEEPR